MLAWVDSYLAETKELRRTGKALVIFDGYSSHLSLRVLLRLVEKNVIVYALPAHTSHLTQPLDVTVFGPMKEAVKSRVSAYVNSLANVLSKFIIYTVCELITEAYVLAATPQTSKPALSAPGCGRCLPLPFVTRPLPSAMPTPTRAAPTPLTRGWKCTSVVLCGGSRWRMQLSSPRRVL